MKTSQKGIDLIKSFEGFRANSYLDMVSVPTIGYGHTKHVQVLKMVEPLQEAQGVKLLAADLEVFEKEVSRLVKVPLTQNEFDGLVSFTYNLGATNLKASKLLLLLNQGKKKEAAREFLRWSYAGGKLVNGLLRRRKAEMNMFLGVV